MKGLALTEAGQYEEALSTMTTSSDKYNQLIKESLETIFPNASKAYKHRISDLEPIQRVCKYKLRLGLQTQPEAPSTTASPRARPRSGTADEFESANEMSDDEGVVDFSDDDDYEDSDIEMSPKAPVPGGFLGKIGGWWNKSN
jgi:hypothetical protein